MKAIDFKPTEAGYPIRRCHGVALDLGNIRTGDF
jgi:hypothetical protein